MTEIRWNYIGIIIIGFFFLLTFEGAVSSASGLRARDENFLFFYRDREAAERLADESIEDGISCGKYLPEAERDGNSGQAALLTVKEENAMKYPNIMDYFFGYDGKIETELMKWLQWFSMFVFVIGILLLFLWDYKPDNWGKRGKFCIAAVLWWIFLTAVSGNVRFPAWKLPGRWADFEGWRRIKDDVAEQVLTMRIYKEIPEAAVYYEGICRAFGLLLLAFGLLFIYHRCCVKMKAAFAVHLCLTIVGLGLYIRLGNPDLKAVIWFFPCYAMTQYLTTCGTKSEKRTPEDI